MAWYWLSLVLYLAVAVAVSAISLLVAFQDRLVYVPAPPGLPRAYPLTPARLRLHYEDVWLRSSDGVRLHSWFIKLFPSCPVSLSSQYMISLYQSQWTSLMRMTWSRLVEEEARSSQGHNPPYTTFVNNQNSMLEVMMHNLYSKLDQLLERMGEDSLLSNAQNEHRLRVQPEIPHVSYII